MKKILIIIILIACALFVLLKSNWLDDVLCGQPNQELQSKLNKVNNAYREKIQLEVIPCETRYLNVTVKSGSVSEIRLDSIHHILYDKNLHSGWITLMVYDSMGNYLFSHSSENQIYRQHGD